MFNNYLVFRMMKLHQEEIERTAKDAWTHFVNPMEENNSRGSSFQTSTTADPCCRCVCA
jgi:hypothetical protein